MAMLGEPDCEPECEFPEEAEPEGEPLLKLAMKVELLREVLKVTPSINKSVRIRTLRVVLLAGDFTEQELRKWSQGFGKTPQTIMASFEVCEFDDDLFDKAKELKPGLFCPLTESRFARWQARIGKAMGRVIDIETRRRASGASSSGTTILMG